MREHVLIELQGIVGPEGLNTGNALPVVSPASAEQMIKVLQLAGKEGLTIFSSFPDCACPKPTEPHSALILSSSRLSAITEIDAANLVAVVEPGVGVAELNQSLASAGLFYPLDPGRGPHTTFGDIITHSLSSIRSIKYGSTKHYIMGLEVALADGRQLKTGGKNVKDVAGYDLTKLITGSGQMLGIVTSIIVKLMPAPACRRLLVAAFNNETDACSAVNALFAAKASPSAVELLDGHTLKLLAANGHSSLPAAEAVLMIEFDGVPEAAEKGAALAAGIVQAHNATLRMPEDGEKVWSARCAVFDCLPCSPDAVLDITVPRSRQAEALKIVRSVQNQRQTPIAAFGHAGDGALFLALIDAVLDSALRNEIQLELLAALKELDAHLNELSPHLTAVADPTSLDCMHLVKNALDPQGILNPGKLTGAC